MRVRIHIERLVLDGLTVDRLQGPQVQRAVEAELTRLLEAEGAGAGLRSGGMMPRLAGGTIEIDRGASPEALGGQIAESLHRSIAT